MTISIKRPCPIDLKSLGVDRSGPSVHCSHCDREVHALYKLTRAEAEAFVAAHHGEDLCISLRLDAHGQPRFVAAGPPDIVPLRRVSARARGVAGLALAVMGCAPHLWSAEDDGVQGLDAAYSLPRPMVPEADDAGAEPPATAATPLPRLPPPPGRSPDGVNYDFDDDIVDGSMHRVAPEEPSSPPRDGPPSPIDLDALDDLGSLDLFDAE